MPSSSQPNIGFGESETVEFKERWNDRAMKDLAAFANTDGGTLYIGIASDGSAVGSDVSDEIQRNISGKIRSHLQLSPSIRVQLVDSVEVLAVTVSDAPGPTFLRGKYYRRSGTTSREVNQQELARVLVEQSDRAWDSIPADASIEDDINEDAVRDFLERALSSNKDQLSDAVKVDDPIDIVLNNLGFLVDGHRPTKAAILLFGRDPQSFFRSAFVRPLYIRGTNNVEDYGDCRGTVIDQIRDALKAVADAYPAELSFNGGGDNRDDEDNSVTPVLGRYRLPYPRLALREALVNAVIHRDYTDVGGHIELKMYPDRLEIQNPGRLPDGLTVEELHRDPHPSRLRNPLLAKGCDIVGLVEGYGTGTLRIIKECKKASLPAPSFEDAESGFRAIIRRVAFTREYLEGMDIRDRQVEALLTLQEGGFSREGYEDVSGLSKRSAARDIRELREKGLVEKHGKGPSTRYTVQRPE